MQQEMERTVSAQQSSNCPFEMVLATHCAPVLLGKKPAALFPERCLPERCSWQLLHKKGLRTLRLWRQKKYPLMFLYRPELLEASLAHECTCSTLKALGYPIEKGAQALLGFLHRRFREAASFPHEVGFFLGYPPEDVVGFMTCPRDCKLCGSWKVYGNEREALMRFDEYKRCRRLLLEHLEKGGSILKENLNTLLQ